MRTLSFRPSLPIRGRAFKGLRGWAGTPPHPPLTDMAGGAAVLAIDVDGESLAFDNGRNAKAAGDHPIRRRSERDVRPGHVLTRDPRSS